MMNYLMVLPVVFKRTGINTFVCESAFAKHLMQLRDDSRHYCDKLVIFAPRMSDDRYAREKATLATLNESETGIEFISAHPELTGRLDYMLRWLLPNAWKSWRQIKLASIVHAGVSNSPFRPFEFLAILLALLKGKKTVFVVDIDQRNSAHMAYTTGALSRRSYWLCKHFYDRFENWQINLAGKHCDLALFKGQALVDTFGHNRPNVKNFLDVAFNKRTLLTPEQLQNKLQRIHNEPVLKTIYFGRLTPYKGILHMIRHVAAAHAKGVAIDFTIIGSGEQQEEIADAIQEISAAGYIKLLPSQPYDDAFFELISEHHLLLAAPLSEDTPRSVFDAMARGVPTHSYDTYYYRDLEVTTGAVTTSPWLVNEFYIEQLITLARNRDKLAELARNALLFACGNDQETWMKRRQQWMHEYVFCHKDDS